MKNSPQIRIAVYVVLLYRPRKHFLCWFAHPLSPFNRNTDERVRNNTDSTFILGVISYHKTCFQCAGCVCISKLANFRMPVLNFFTSNIFINFSPRIIEGTCRSTTSSYTCKMTVISTALTWGGKKTSTVKDEYTGQP